jgi:hypothetical protein
MKAQLNEEGQKIYGDIFPNGEVPVLNPVDFEAMLGDKIQGVYLVAWHQLSAEQQSKIIEFLKTRFNGAEADIRAQIAKFGLPLRASLVEYVSMERRFFC